MMPPTQPLAAPTSQSSVAMASRKHWDTKLRESRVTQTTPDGDLALILSKQANAKYEWANQTADDYQDPLCMFTPSKALAWDLLYKDATRFRFTA